MKNAEILEIFRKNYPEVKVEDYRPLWTEFTENRQGITIWTENGDVILYFSKPDQKPDS